MNEASTLDYDALTRLEDELRETVQISAAPRQRIPAPPVFTDYEDVMRECHRLTAERAKMYDLNGMDMAQNLERAAKLAALKLNVDVTPYMVAIVLESVKDVRRAVNPGLVDAHLDGINYRAFATQFAIAEAAR